MNTIERIKARGKPILCFRADGCMAHDHKFQWLGIIADFCKQERGDNILLAKVSVIKMADDPNINATNTRQETAVAANIQQLYPGIYVVYT